MFINKLQKRHIPLIALVISAISSAGCSDNQFGAAGVGNKSGEKSKSEQTEQGENIGSNVDEEETTADQPVEVAGAFLTCKADDALPTNSENEAGVGCAIFDKEGRKDLTGISVSYTALDASGIDLGAAFIPSTGKYDSTTSLPKVGLNQTKVKASYNVNNTPSVLEATIIVAPSAILKEVVFGTTIEYHVGNGNINFSQNQDCQGKLQTINDGDIKLIANFEVLSDETEVSVHLTENCGLQYTNNLMVMRSATQTVHSAAIPPNTSDADFPAQKLSKGSYTFEIQAGLRADKQDYDDFLIGQMKFRAKGDVKFAEPISSK